MIKERLIEILTQQRLVKEEALAKVIQMHKDGKGRLSDLLVNEGLLSESDLTMLLSNELHLPVLNLKLFKVDPQILRLIPRKLAERYEVIPLSKIGQTLTLAMGDPMNILALDELQELTHCAIRPVITTSKDIQNALATYYSDIQDIDDLVKMADEDLQIIKDEKVEEGGAGVDDAPIIKMVDLVLLEAMKRRASDIHFEPYEKSFRVRYRIDGELVEAYSPPRNIQGAIMARLKIVSGLDITERRKPQDGRFKAKLMGKDIDFRVSVLPMVYGEKAVIRLLDKSNLKVDLSSLGFLPESLKAIDRALKKPFGMVIITGPTGSGKSTTLYSILNRLNTPDRNVMTIEDPVEYQVEGITQTQVAPEIGLGFAEGLRSLLRQSPDIILIGEIRDNETADIATKAALTGHLVFSTLHTNSAAGAITRLLDMKVEAFLIAASIIMIGAQRLCRKICEHCKEPHEIPSEVFKRLQVDPKQMNGIKPFHGKGCTRCGGTGFYGRLATLEVLEPDEEIRQMIIERRSSDQIEEVARKNGMKLLFENAFENFRKGLTTLDEVFRIASR